MALKSEELKKLPKVVAVINGSGSLQQHHFFLFLVAITRTGGVEIGCKETLNSYKTNTILVTYQNP